jgi:serine kinase of HPr protein (carbohydrate metabolism regulator)
VPPTAASEDGLLLHGTAVAIAGRAALLRGPTGSGKSDLALRAVMLAAGAAADGTFDLVADDQVRARREGDGLVVSPPPQIAGLIEVRGLGILPLPHAEKARLTLLVDLMTTGRPERLPDPWPFEDLLGIALPVLALRPFEASAPIKLALALTREPWRSREG